MQIYLFKKNRKWITILSRIASNRCPHLLEVLIYVDRWRIGNPKRPCWCIKRGNDRCHFNRYVYTSKKERPFQWLMVWNLWNSRQRNLARYCSWWNIGNVSQRRDRNVQTKFLTDDDENHQQVIANEQAERRRLACEAASLMPREVLWQAEKSAEKFSIALQRVDSLGILAALDFTCSFTWLLMTLVNKRNLQSSDNVFCHTTVLVRTTTRYFKFARTNKCYFSFAVWNSTKLSKQKNK